MGTTPLSRHNWYIFLVSVAIENSIITFVWHELALFLASSPLHTSITIALVGFCTFGVLLFVWFRQVQTRNTWVYAWILFSPVFLGSVFLFSFVPGIAVLALWGCVIILALWGYYARFYPMLGLDSRLHKARYARADELAELHSFTPEPHALLLGVNRLHHFFLVRSVPNRPELGNMLIVGPTRSGKGLLATSQLLSWGNSVIVNDIKGDLFTQTAGYRARIGKVYVLDPQGYGHRYDPLLGKHTEDALFSSAARLLFTPDEGDGQIFTQRATAMLTQLFLAARAEKVPPFPYVREMIRAGLQTSAKGLDALSPHLATQFLDVAFSEANFTDRFLLSAWGTLTARMRPILTETVIRTLNGADFTPGQLMQGERPVTIYLRWPERDLLAISPLVRLMWSSIIDELITTYDKAEGKDCKPVLLLVDEAGRTAIPSLADSSTTVVGRGISLWLAIQSLSQLEAIYGKARAQVLRDNMETQLYYRPTDLVTAEYLEHRIGRKSAYAKSITERGKAESSHGQSEQGIPLLTAQEIMQLKDEQVIGFHRRLPPFKIRRVDWRHHTPLKKRRQQQPPHLSALPPLAAFPFAYREAETQDTNGYIDPDVILRSRRENMNV